MRGAKFQLNTNSRRFLFLLLFFFLGLYNLFSLVVVVAPVYMLVRVCVCDRKSLSRAKKSWQQHVSLCPRQQQQQQQQLQLL